MQGDRHDEEYVDPHGECAREIAALRNVVSDLLDFAIPSVNELDEVAAQYEGTEEGDYAKGLAADGRSAIAKAMGKAT
jgi:hypothetical protein